MALTPYCEPDEVRAALGVNDIELPDTVLSLPVYEIGLVRELTKVSASLPAAFSTAFDVAEESRTDLQQALIDATRLFSVYAAAKQVGVSLGSFMPKDVGDGKASVGRFSDSPYRDILARVEAMYTASRASLSDTVTLVTGGTASTASTVPRTMFVKSSRGYDPVTGV